MLTLFVWRRLGEFALASPRHGGKWELHRENGTVAGPLVDDGAAAENAASNK